MRAFDTFDARAFKPAISWARRHERKISALSLAGGFASTASPLATSTMLTRRYSSSTCWWRAFPSRLHGLESAPTAGSHRIRLAPPGRHHPVRPGLPVVGFAFSISVAFGDIVLAFPAGDGAIFIANEYMRRYHAGWCFPHSCSFSPSIPTPSCWCRWTTASAVSLSDQWRVAVVPFLLHAGPGPIGA